MFRVPGEDSTNKQVEPPHRPGSRIKGLYCHRCWSSLAVSEGENGSGVPLAAVAFFSFFFSSLLAGACLMHPG